MRILFVTPPPFLPNRLHRIRAFELLKILCKKHEVHFLGATTEDTIPDEFEEIKSICSSVNIVKQAKIQASLQCLMFFWLPAEVAYCYSGKMKHKLTELSKKHQIELIYIKRLRGAIYLSTPDNIPIIIDTTDAMSLFYNRLAHESSKTTSIIYWFESLKYKLYEKTIAKTYKLWITCSDIDSKYIKMATKTKVFTIPNPVDTAFFKPTRNKETGYTLLFRGLMDKPVNIDAIVFFLKNVFPKIQKTMKNVRLLIVGPHPTSAVTKYHNNKDIVVTDYVKDLRKVMRKATVTICPLRVGTGTRQKILQSWAMGIPVVSTMIGSEGLPTIHNKNILIAKSSEDMSRMIITLLTNQKLQKKLAKYGLLTVKKEYSLSAVGKHLDKILRYVTS